MSFAARARRLDESAEIVVFERDPYVSFANCGLPYYIAGEIQKRDDLLLHTPETLAASLKLDVRIGHEVVGIDRAAKTIQVRATDGTSDDRAVRRPVAEHRSRPHRPADRRTRPRGVKAASPRTAQRPRCRRDRAHWSMRAPAQPSSSGAGSSDSRWPKRSTHRGLSVTLVDLADQVMTPLDPEMARTVQSALTRAGVDVRLGVSATEITADHGRPVRRNRAGRTDRAGNRGPPGK